MARGKPLRADTDRVVKAHSFQRDAETFGLETPVPWATDVFRLLFNTPRAYTPLVDAWQTRHPGTKKALSKLVELGFVAYQGPVIVDTRSGASATSSSRAVTRWRTTARGTRMLDEFSTDVATLLEAYPKLKVEHVNQTLALLEAFHLEDSHAKYGISLPHAIELAQMEPRLARWWVSRWSEAGYLVSLPVKYADVREVVPAHWRITKALCRQVTKVASAYGLGHLSAEYHLSRTSFLADIEPARIGLTGATDFDHDVETQRLLAEFARSPRWAHTGVFAIEPRLVLPADALVSPREFTMDGGAAVFYQPDAELRAVEDVDGRSVVRRVVVEYERFQSRRDAWSHLERFVGWLHTRCLPFEHGLLMFVVDGDQRRRTYVELIEAFVDHLIENPQLSCVNPITLAVSSMERVAAASDPLNMTFWNRIVVPPTPLSLAVQPVLHDPKESPYDLYFSRRSRR